MFYSWRRKENWQNMALRKDENDSAEGTFWGNFNFGKVEGFEMGRFIEMGAHWLVIRYEQHIRPKHCASNELKYKIMRGFVSNQILPHGKHSILFQQ